MFGLNERSPIPLSRQLALHFPSADLSVGVGVASPRRLFLWAMPRVTQKRIALYDARADTHAIIIVIPSLLSAARG